MNRPAAPGAGPAIPHLFVVLALRWLAGAAMRLPLLVVPPIIPLIHDDLHMSETQIGALMGLPLTMLALAAVPGSLLIARFGVIRVAVIGLFVTALAAAARGAAIDVWTLYAATLLMGFGVAILQPAMPTLVRAFARRRMWLATAIYTNGMMIGVTLGPALTIPLILPLVGGSWRRDLLVWAIPGVLSAAVVGFATSLTFVVTFGLPAILAPPDDVHRMAGGMFTISYTIAVIVPILCGALWDITGVPWMAFIPIGLCGCGLTVFGTALTLRNVHD